jgi:hypothetical protein
MWARTRAAASWQGGDHEYTFARKTPDSGVIAIVVDNFRRHLFVRAIFTF